MTGAAGKNTLMAAPVREQRPAGGAAPVLDVGAAKPLFEVRSNTFYPAFGTFFYSVSKDAQRFLINYVEVTSEPVLNVIMNWEQAVAKGSR